jgi:serine protease Do
MKNVKFGAAFLGLTLAVAGAVSVAAQTPRTFSFRAIGGGQLGMSISDTPNGVRVDSVHAGTPAEKAGFREGDLVVEFDGERVRSVMQLTRLVRETAEGRSVTVAVMRDGKRQALQVTPEAGRSFTFDDQPRRFEYRLPERFEFRGPDGGVPFMGSRPRLGVTLQSLTPDLEEYFGAKNGGALVSSVTPNSAAARAGIKAGDVIVSIDGRQVSDSSDLMRELRALKGEVTIVVLRDRKEMTMKATLDDEPRGSRGII